MLRETVEVAVPALTPFQVRLCRQLSGEPRLAVLRPVQRVERVVAVARPDNILLLIFGADVEVITFALEIAVTPGEVHPVFPAAALFGIRQRTAEVETLDLFLRDDVDDARDRVGAVGGRGAVTQHFDALDDGTRNRIEVDEIALAVIRERIRRHALAVEHGQRRLHGQTTQCGRGRAAGEVETGIPARLNGSGVVGRKALKRFRNRVDAALFERLGADDGDRRRGFRVGASKDRTGNDDFFERLLLCKDL